MQQTVLPAWVTTLPLPAQRRCHKNLGGLRQRIDETIEPLYEPARAMPPYGPAPVGQYAGAGPERRRPVVPSPP